MGTPSYFTDPNKAVLNNLTTLDPMRGYWIHMTATSATWVGR